MNNKYKNSTTWAGSSWRNGATKVIRVPIALEEKIMVYARALDEENAMLHGIAGDSILNAIAEYIEMRRENLHPNQHSKGKGLDTRSRTWDELRRFQEWVKNRQNK
ncbi:hypothetical protein IQ276_025850 [Desmonostoc muscorum LEGE 12446]|uniref:Uncharacterized protein n=1 Tax=Desmonostoc muscorum LEGE 12446 TaxID=1828758 RepID=A0A8J7DBE6_DESMC|nr:hypothetical protein [Desmonostoc muscorum]MCF2149788.1 hypothetical protein [Desmonostoc muscorum LEGE 12446]